MGQFDSQTQALIEKTGLFELFSDMDKELGIDAFFEIIETIKESTKLKRNIQKKVKKY